MELTIALIEPNKKRCEFQNFSFLGTLHLLYLFFSLFSSKKKLITKEAQCHRQKKPPLIRTKEQEERRNYPTKYTL